MTTHNEHGGRTCAERTDSTFPISIPALLRIRAGAAAHDISMARYFRALAFALLTAEKPRFLISGSDLCREFTCGVSEKTLGGLRHLADRLGIPEAGIGEAVACADVEIFTHAGAAL